MKLSKPKASPKEQPKDKEKAPTQAPMPKVKSRSFVEKLEKREKIKLQNIIFGTKEHHLMVSNIFLDRMTKKFISKRMTVINASLEAMQTSKSPKNFFEYFDDINALLDELIKVEPYYHFKNPTPSVYKKSFNLQRQHNISLLIYRMWKFITGKYPIKDGVLEENIPYYDSVIAELFTYAEFFSDEDINQISIMNKQIHGNDAELFFPEKNQSQK